MFKLANLIMGGAKFLGADPAPTVADWTWVDSVTGSVKAILVPILSIVGAAGLIWAIVLGVNMARADSQEKREEAKKRLVSLIVGIVILIVLIMFFLFLFEPLLEQIAGTKNVDFNPET